MPARNDILKRTFYERGVEVVAQELLGRYLVVGAGRDRIGGRIVETEAYGGPGDPASHADRAPAGRARIMFGAAGIAYVYFTYGMHHCVNAVAGRVGTASAVLIRALEPVWGVERMRAAGAPPGLADRLLASGPGRVCRALGIDRSMYGADLTVGPLRVVDGESADLVETGTRIGLSRDDGRPWRFWTPSPSVSRGRAG